MVKCETHTDQQKNGCKDKYDKRYNKKRTRWKGRAGVLLHVVSDSILINYVIYVYIKPKNVLTYRTQMYSGECVKGTHKLQFLSMKFKILLLDYTHIQFNTQCSIEINIGIDIP